MMAIAIILPVVSAFLVLLIQNYQARGFIVIATTVILSINSLIFLKMGPFSYTPHNAPWGEIITVLDFLMLVFFVYVGVSLRHPLVLVLAITQLAPLAMWEFGTGAHTEIEPAFIVDHLSIIMTLIISIIGSLICFYAIKYIADHEHHNKPEKSRQSRFLFWMIIFLGAMNGLVFANNLYWLYFFWECTTLCCYMLIAHDLTKEAINNAARALWMGSVGGTTFICAIIYLYSKGGAAALSLQNLLQGDMGVVVAAIPIVLLCITAFTKAAQLPFQSWLLGAMVAPTPVSALLHSSTMVKAGVYLVVRLAPGFSPERLGALGTYIGAMVALVGAFTFFGASFLAISQTTGKRVLAYSTIANLGLIIACAGINTPLALAAAILLIIFHAISKGLLFLCAGTIEHVIWSREIDDMEALAEKAPIVTFITATGILSMFLPPFGMLLAKWMAMESSLSISRVAGSISPALHVILNVVMLLVAICMVLASAATIVFWAKWLGRMLQVLPRLHYKKVSLSVVYMLPLWLLLAGIFVFGIGIGWIYNYGISYAVNDLAQFSQVVPLAGNVWLESSVASPSTMPVPIGFFPVLMLFPIVIIILAVPMLMIKPEQKELRPIYICGEQCGGTDADEFMTAGGQKAKIELGGYYFTKAFSEVVMNPVVNTIAISLMIVMLGVILGVSLK